MSEYKQERMMEILIVEDDKELARGISLALKKENRIFLFADTVKAADKLLKDKEPALILLDVNLPDGNGLSLCQRIRKTSPVPIIFLTANDMEYDEVAGLEAGGDDYITKPFSLAVLRARVEAALRRKPSPEYGEQPYTEGEFSFDFENMRFLIKQEEIQLSKTEQRVLRLLVMNRGHVVNRDLFYDRVWSDSGEYVDENALSVVIRRLRSKLEENPAKPVFIRTVYGLGYCWGEKR